ncbi:MAG: response regulator transcription factor [Actinomycetota bacterium]|nr:response regulator transcription factor [Actinomycetota bacterium]MDA3037654.1 response regulator transcription factor [Actinomycetota bacterium]
MSGKILLVEDEHSIAEPIIYNLKREGFSVTHVDEGPIALEIFNEEKFDLIILDLMLPEISGLDICRSIRKESNVPIIMVTAKDSEADRVSGLELGADDYVTKPFSVRELMSRVRAVLRRTTITKTDKNDKSIKSGNIEINLSKYEAKVDDKNIDLTPREFELLYAFCENEGNLLSREQIFDEIWGYSFIGNTKTLDVHIQRIREKIEKDPREPKRLITVRGVGYKLVTDG